MSDKELEEAAANYVSLQVWEQDYRADEPVEKAFIAGACWYRERMRCETCKQYKVVDRQSGQLCAFGAGERTRCTTSRELSKELTINRI